MKKKGFTLIELLAVIVVLAIIALISAPIIIKVIERAKKGAFEDTAYGIIDAVKIYYANASFDGKQTEEMFTFPSDTRLKLSGEKPKSGNAKLEEDGSISLAVSNGVWCAVKNSKEEKITIKDYRVEDCIIKGGETAGSCFTLNENGNTIMDYTCADTDIIIPSEINGITITSIGENAFRQKGLTSVKLPDSIINIGAGAFSLNQLASAKLPSNITSMGRTAFHHNQLQSIEIPSSLTTIEGYAFSYNQLTNITIPSSVTRIKSYAFTSNQLKDVEMQSGVTSIGDSAFSYNQLSGITIPNSVTNIEQFAFYNNQLQSVTIPYSVISIGKAAFTNNQLPDSEAFIYKRNADGTEDKSMVVSYGGAKRVNVLIPNGVTTIGSDAFYENQLQSVTIANDVTNIESHAFYKNQLKSITIPSNVISIGNSAFHSNQLASIEIPSSVTSIGNSAFHSNKSNMKVTINKPAGSISGSPWGASSVEWVG